MTKVRVRGSLLVAGVLAAALIPGASFSPAAAAVPAQVKQCRIMVKTVFTFKKKVSKKKRTKAIKLPCGTGSAVTPGSPGPTGSSGANGKPGATGPKGTTGATGPGAGGTGPEGPIGPTGIAGATGQRGATGATGIGLPGLEGPTGERGLTGLDGVTGTTGLEGVAGLIGPTGLQGIPGLDGLTGATGLGGLPGLDGVTGATGLEGVTGATGLQGLLGPTGSTGLAGVTGATGLQGLLGPTGATGVAGVVPDLFATMPSSQSVNSSNTNTLTGWDEDYDPDNSFDPVTGTYTAPTDGDYEVDATSIGGPVAAVTQTQGAGNTTELLIVRNGVIAPPAASAQLPLLNVDVTLILTLRVPLASNQVSKSAVLPLNAGDTITLAMANGGTMTQSFLADLKITPLP
ncbi:MAG: collagen-like protein [Thermoleophilia bacterium]|nr:collagen-like protein [Thermoleophilia bacterium]